jgi:hypothetical protein
MKKLLLIALLFGAPVAASAQNYEELSDVNMVAATAPATVLQVDSAVYADSTTAARPRAVRVATHPRSLTVAMSHPAGQIVLASADIGG